MKDIKQYKSFLELIVKNKGDCSQILGTAAPHSDLIYNCNSCPIKEKLYPNHLTLGSVCTYSHALQVAQDLLAELKKYELIENL